MTFDSIEVLGGANPTVATSSQAYVDPFTFEEITISTGGNDPSIATGCVRINFVTKRGGNSWRGSARFYITDGSLQQNTVADRDGNLTGNYTADELYPGYIGNAIDNIKDWGGEVGGPVVRDRFFVWGSYGKQDIKQFVGASPDNTQLKNIHGKANIHLGDAFVLNYTYVKAQKTKQGRGASATRPPDTTFNQGGPSGTSHCNSHCCQFGGYIMPSGHFFCCMSAHDSPCAMTGGAEGFLQGSVCAHQDI